MIELYNLFITLTKLQYPPTNRPNIFIQQNSSLLWFLFEKQKKNQTPSEYIQPWLPTNQECIKKSNESQKMIFNSNQRNKKEKKKNICFSFVFSLQGV